MRCMCDVCAAQPINPTGVKVGMYSGPEIHEVSPVGSQYGIFCPVPGYFPGNLQKPETRLIFAMAKMSPRESHFLAVGVVRLAPNLHMYHSTHQDLSFHGGECRMISDGKGFVCFYLETEYRAITSEKPEAEP